MLRPFLSVFQVNDCSEIAGDDIVQCVPTKKGHQILYKGYTYMFKSRLQCGSEQWCCSYRQKTGCISTINMQSNGVEVEDKIPEWVSIYYVKNDEKKYLCNICEVTVITTNKKLELINHIKDNHHEVFELHKENPQANVGFRIEFLHFNVLKDTELPKDQSIILGEVCEPVVEEVVPHSLEKEDEQPIISQPITITPRIKKTRERKERDPDKIDNRKRSWVWKYFHQMSNIIFQCSLCNVVLSIKGCNTNNMNRHIRTRHPSIYRTEAMNKRNTIDTAEPDLLETEIPIAVKTEEICADKDIDDILESTMVHRQRRSWIWLYFNRISATSAQCKLCNRNIVHGGNATGNMNRHLKMIHRKTGEDHHWIWKVFDCGEEDYYLCKICQYQCVKFADIDKSVACILDHLRVEHGVISGEQIITGTDDGDEEELQ